MTIKYYHVNNSAGFPEIPVFNIADPTMDENAFEVYQFAASVQDKCNRTMGICVVLRHTCNAGVETLANKFQQRGVLTEGDIWRRNCCLI